ncbi:MAG: hypothetical protein ACI883_000784 [Candidatus Azotimanducaceae bacterium]|jgi:hypothetical protein|tara:strand:+ start:38155 stop:39171 length:1017 start_codon:yes stop_codon:yes gene_type:complete
MLKRAKLGILIILSSGFILVIGVVSIAMSRGHDLPNAGRFAWQMVAKKVFFTEISAKTTTSQTYWMGDIQDKELSESSGLASSNLSDNVLWSFNDSGDSARIFALSTTGVALGQWQINIPNPTDWEAMDSFVIGGKAYLLLADTGDNLRWRPFVSVLVVAEPEIDSNNQIPLEPIWQKSFRYPDGPRDVEAVAVDTLRGEILLLSKRNVPNELYRIDLEQIKTSADLELIAEKVADIYSIPRLNQGEESLFADAAPHMGKPTGMSISANHLLVTTLKDAYLLNRADLTQPAIAIHLPYIGQREAITFARNANNSAYISRERHNGKEIADIFRVDFELP